MGNLKPRANGRNIVDQQLPTYLDVTCCVRLHTLLHVVGCSCVLLRKVWNQSNFSANNSNISFVPWSPKRSATMLHPFAQLLQHCWGRARSLRNVYKDLWVVSFPRCTAGPNIVGSCCIRLHTTANMHAACGVNLSRPQASLCCQEAFYFFRRIRASATHASTSNIRQEPIIGPYLRPVAYFVIFVCCFALLQL